MINVSPERAQMMREVYDNWVARRDSTLAKPSFEKASDEVLRSFESEFRGVFKLEEIHAAREIIIEQQSRAMDALPHRRWLDTENLGDVRRRQLFQIAQDERLAVEIRQLIDCLLRLARQGLAIQQFVYPRHHLQGLRL